MRKDPVPDGARLYVAASMPAAIGTGTASNASSAVVSVANVLAANALVLLDSEDWPELAGRVARVSAADVASVTLAGIDTSNTEKFPAGGKLTLTQLPQDSAFTRLPYVTALGLSGGDLQTGTSEYLDVETAGEYATGRSPRRMEYSISFNADGAGLGRQHVTGGDDDERTAPRRSAHRPARSRRT